MKYLIRNCLEEDLLQVSQIEYASFDDPYPYRLFAALLNDFAGGFRLAAAEKGIIGYSILSFSTERGTMIISSLAVRPEFRRTGVGSELLRDAIELTSSLPALRDTDKIVLQVAEINSSAQSLYNKFGFKRVRELRNYYGRGKNGIQMELTLKI